MGSPSDVTFGVPFACYDGKYRTAYPQGDYPLPAPSDLSASPASSTAIVAELDSIPAWVMNVEWSIKRAADAAWTVAAQQRTTSFMFDELDTNTTYQVRARFQYLEFYSGYSPEASATTTDSLPFPLPPGHFVPAKAALQTIYPRPDTETSTYARHRKAYYDGTNPIEYRIPVGVSFGAFPYKFEVIEGPEGLTVGETLDDIDYAIVTWTPTGSVSNATVTILVTDQELNTLEITWAVSTSSSTNDFIFVDGATGSDSNNGAYGSPLKTLQAAFISGFQNRIVYIREGEYDGDISLGANVPTAALGFPGEDVVLDMTTSNGVHASGTTADVFMQNLTLDGGDPNAKNQRTIWFDNRAPRHTFHDLHFTNPINGSVSKDNATSIFFNAQDFYRDYVYIVDCTEDGRPTDPGGNAAGLFVAFTTRNSLYERNTVTNSNAGQGNLTLKASCWKSTARRNYVHAIHASQGFAFGAIDQINGTMPAGNNELCYNVVRYPSGTGLVFNYWFGSSSPDEYWAYRNTIYGRITVRNASASNGPFILEDNVIVVATGNPVETPGGTGSSVFNTGDECQGTPSEGIIDTTTLELTGSFRDDWLGQRGAEISA